jgi:hypothetical protein
VALRELVWTDESGTHSGSAWCLVAGYRASPGQWKRFDAEWWAVLNRYGVEAFHSKQYFNRKKITDPKRNPYLNWPDKKAASYFGDLLGVINGRKIYPVGCAVDVRAFEAYGFRARCVLAGYLAKASRRKSRDPVPYHLAFRLMLADALKTAAPGTELHIIIAEQAEYQQRAGEVYTLTKQLGSAPRFQQLKSFGMLDPKDKPALQAADLFAGRWYNFLVRGRQRLNRENVVAMNVLTHKRWDMPTCAGANMEAMFAELRQP